MSKSTKNKTIGRSKSRRHIENVLAFFGGSKKKRAKLEKRLKNIYLPSIRRVDRTTNVVMIRPASVPVPPGPTKILPPSGKNRAERRREYSNNELFELRKMEYNQARAV